MNQSNESIARAEDGEGYRGCHGRQQRGPESIRVGRDEDAAARAEDAADAEAKELASESFEMARVRRLNQSLLIIEHVMGIGGEA